MTSDQLGELAWEQLIAELQGDWSRAPGVPEIRCRRFKWKTTQDTSYCPYSVFAVFQVGRDAKGMREVETTKWKKERRTVAME